MIRTHYPPDMVVALVTIDDKEYKIQSADSLSITYKTSLQYCAPDMIEADGRMIVRHNSRFTHLPFVEVDINGETVFADNADIMTQWVSIGSDYTYETEVPHYTFKSSKEPPLTITLINSLAQS